MAEQPTDGEVIGESLSDPARFAEIFERHFERISRYLIRRVGLDAGQELAAQTFEEAFRHRGRFDLGRAEASPWLYGIASHLVSHHARSERTKWQAYAKSAARESVVGDLHEEALEAMLALPLVAAAIAQMAPGDRDAILLFAWADLSYLEIAAALDIPVGTVRSRINRVRSQLSELIDTEEAITNREHT